ncbi:type VII secretion target [Actinoplanes philippinensis]|uniref:type VII secretion target n=1 Tax=Actinoplanes philippinensis TaxID=35752 RepID=UPI0033E90385
MQPGQLGVDVVALHVMGADVADAAATLRGAVKVAGPGLAPADQPGSAAAAAARAAETAWSANLDRLTARVERLGRKMTTAADSYRATDQAGADELRRAGSQVLR